MQHKIMTVLLIVVPLVGVGQSARKTNKLLKQEYVVVAHNFESSLQKSDSIETVYRLQDKRFRYFVQQSERKQDRLNQTKQDALKMYSTKDSLKKLTNFSFSKEVIEAIVVPDIDFITNSTLMKMEASNSPMSWPLSEMNKDTSITVERRTLKEKNAILFNDLAYVKEKIHWIDSSSKAKLMLINEMEAVENQLFVFDNEMDASQQMVDLYYRSLANYEETKPNVVSPTRIINEKRADGTIAEIQDTEDEVPIIETQSGVTPHTVEEAIYAFTDEPAEFPGGKEALNAFIEANLKIPEVAMEQRIEGKCYLQFIVSARGNISNVKVVRGVPDCVECDIEAERVIRSMPKWIPGKNGGKPVNSVFNLPVSFKLPK